jgi:hypothetical protein
MGRFAKQNEKEIEEDYHTWKSVNVGGYTSQRTTQAYRHGRCYMCSKPVSTTNLDPEVELFCQQCGEDLTKLDCGFDDNINPKRGMERRDRDDGEEWGRFPIPQSDDELEGDTWLDESEDSDQERNVRPACVVSVETAFNKEPNIKIGEDKINGQTTDDFAFRHGPRRDGTILRKDGSTLDLYDLNTLKTIHINIINEEPKMMPDDVPRRPHWTSALLTFQRLQLKMAYKSKTKLRARIMKQIRRRVCKVAISSSTQLGQLRLLSIHQYTQFETAQAFMNDQGTYHGGSTLHQCMNSIRPEPPKPKKKKGLKLRIRVAVQRPKRRKLKRPKRRKLNFSTVTVPGTPEGETTTQEVRAKESKKEEGISDDLDLYYKVYSRYKSEAGESNAESAAKTTAFEAEYQYLLVKKNKEQEVKEKATKLHSLSPITPTRETLEFKVMTKASQKGHGNNNVQEISIETDYTLYPS